MTVPLGSKTEPGRTPVTGKVAMSGDQNSVRNEMCLGVHSLNGPKTSGSTKSAPCSMGRGRASIYVDSERLCALTRTMRSRSRRKPKYDIQQPKRERKHQSLYPKANKASPLPRICLAAHTGNLASTTVLISSGRHRSGSTIATFFHAGHRFACCANHRNFSLCCFHSRDRDRHNRCCPILYLNRHSGLCHRWRSRGS